MKMTEKQLLEMKRLVENAKDDCDFISVKELDDLERILSTELYVQQIKSFVDVVKNAMPGADASDEECQRFYDTPWFIGFGGHSVTIDNEATIYQGILDALNDFVENCL